MWYSKKEEYVFRMPAEYKAYLEFKENLKDIGVPFTEQTNVSQQTILIFTSGAFKKEDKPCTE